MSTDGRSWVVWRRGLEAVGFWKPIRRWKLTFIWLLTLLMLFSLGSGGMLAQTQASDQFLIRFQTRQFIPAPRLEMEAIRTQWAAQPQFPVGQQESATGQPEQRVHFLVQFKDLPRFDDRQQAADQGIDLIAYVTGNTYIASAGFSSLKDVQSLQGVRWAGPLQAEDKIGPDLKAGKVGAWAQTPDGREVLTIQLHQDVDLAQGEALVAYFGGKLVGVAHSVPALTAIFAPGQAQQIAGQDIVQYVDAVELPLEEHNDGARVAANVTPLAQAPYNLTGTGVTVLVYDSGMVDLSHPDFGARVIETDGDATETTRAHSTHVAGTVGGDGSNSNGTDSAGNPNGGTAGQWAGMAPAVNIRSFGSSGSTDVLYDSSGDLNVDFTTAISNGIDLATMSLGNNVVPNGFPCGQLGDYTNTAILIDNIVRGSITGQQLIYFESVGNERTDPDGPGPTPPAPCGHFSSISSPATAKNSIGVGAINSNNNTVAVFSSFGPTDDGRIKPDITAPGDQSTGDNGITSPCFIDADFDGNLDAGEVQDAYVVMWGTSMATPVAAGSTALLIEQWQSTRGAGTRPLPHTVKAILVHTATDRGNAGPDYQFGWGTLNAQAAVDLVIADDTDDLVHVDQVDNGDTDFYTFNSDGATDIQVTVAWDDPPATRLAAPTLINDLDLRLIDPDGVIYQPFTLNPAAPATAATTGNDAVNNVEMVVGAANAGTWTVSVAGTTVPQGPQEYSLITPADAALNQPPVADANGPYTTDEGLDASLNGSGIDPDGDVLSYAWDFEYDGVTFDVHAIGQTPDFNLVGQDGVFSIALRVTDPDGAFDIDQTTVTVNNVAPSVTLVSDAPQDEGSLVTVTGVATDPGWLENLTATIDWDDGTVEPISGTLENVRPDASLTFEVSHTYGDNGIYNVEVCVFDDDTNTCQTFAVEIVNVSPMVSIDPGQVTVIDEGDWVDVLAHFSDPGWLDTYTSLIDWGTPAGDTDVGNLVVTVEGPPLDQGQVTGSHQYGDNGLFPVTVTVTDNNGGSGSGSFSLTVNNIDPAAEIDESGAILINGIPTFLAQIGEPMDFTGWAADPGSDDFFLGWDWDDGSPVVTIADLVNPPNPDPFPSPDVEPRDVTDVRSHTFGDACLYEISFLVDDDDGGHGEDQAMVIINGDAGKARSEGYWQHQYSGKGKIDFDRATLECYLAMVGYMSTVFDEERDASTIEQAYDVLFLKKNRGSEREQFDRELLTVWLNFANGALEFTDISGVVATAESVRLDPSATDKEIRRQTKILHQINH